MRGARLLPEGSDLPREHRLGAVELSILTIDDLVPDFEAVIESGGDLHDLFHPGDRWPDGLTIRDDLIDLAWHQKEFDRGTSFAWGLWRPGRERYLGSAYVFPDVDGGTHAHAVHWIRSGENDPALRVAFARDWEAWVRSWPLPSVRFSPETI